MRRAILSIISIVLVQLSAWAIDLADLDTGKDAYFVKVKSSGKGDGSSWENAIGNTEFSYLLGHAKSGATFHVAAGLYTPILDTKYEIATTGTSRRYYITRPVNIIGGYSSSPEKGEVANSKINKTIFSADCEGDNIEGNFKENRDNDCFNCLSIDISKYKTSTISIFGIQFEGGYTYFGPYSRNWNANCSIGGSTVNFENCTFTDSYNALSYTHSSVYFTSCTFRGNQRVFLWTVGDVSISNSLFANNDYISIGASASYAEGSQDENKTRHVNILNNSFKENGSIVISGKRSSYLNGYNNTIISSEGTLELNSSETTMTLVGNIFCVQSISFKDTCDKNFTSSYNLYQTEDPEFSTPMSSSDILDTKMETIVNNRLVEHPYDSDYLRLLNKELSDGRPLTFPLSETILKEDQRHVKRNDPTCLGAFEIDGEGLMPRHRYVGLDTLTSGEKYASIDHPFATGYYPDVLEVIKNSNGEDSLIIHHQLYVKPSVHQETFYVKLGGTGYGMSWDDAMGDTAFAIALCNATDNMVFHIAEGTYHPIFTLEGDLGNSINMPVYYTNKNISIIGGYSEDAADETAKSDPVQYHTIFSCDIEGNDTNLIFTDNLQECFVYEPASTGTIELTGIEFIGNVANKSGLGLFTSSNYKSESSSQRNHIVFTNCKFLSTCNALQIFGATTIHLNGCEIEGGISIGDMKEIILENSSIAVCHNDTYLDADNIQITNNTIFDADSNNRMLSLGKHNNKTFDLLLCHNTILSRINFEPGNISFYGNIFGNDLTQASYTDRHQNAEIFSSFNIYMDGVLYSLKKDELIKKSESDFVFTEENLLEILKHDKDGFIAVKEENDLTLTIAITADTLSDGRSILIPLHKDAKADQRGMKRRTKTPIGAYENCPDTSNPDSYFDIPSIFTPGNGVNDIFLQNHEVYIYDLFGRLICHSSNGWNGYYHSKLAPYGVYVYVAISKDGSKKKGTIELINVNR